MPLLLTLLEIPSRSCNKVLGQQITPRILFDFICNPIENIDGVAKYAPYGLRKVESSLIRDGYSREDVVVAHPDYVEKFIGPETQVVGTYEMDPLGNGSSDHDLHVWPQTHVV